MAALSDHIEQFLKELLAEQNNLEIKRNELALHFDCAPSQINYVLTSRFTLDNGYIIESRRGGGGYIRITRVSGSDNNRYLLSAIQDKLSNALSEKDAIRLIESLYQRGIIEDRERQMLSAMMVLPVVKGLNVAEYDVVRAILLKKTLQVFLES